MALLECRQDAHAESFRTGLFFCANYLLSAILPLAYSSQYRNKYSTPLWAITLLGSLFIWVLSLTMVLTVYSRFFKLYMATAIAPIPLASFAGQPSSSIGVAFLKTYAGICLEGCIIVLACVIFSAFASTPPAVAGDGVAAATVVWNYVGELIFNMLVLVGCIRMSDRIVRELLGI